jgi:predicted O-linked N-acetylglucosamine transferase (SPINDLY family)
MKQQRYADAARIFASAAALAPADAVLWLHLAQSSFKQGLYEQAEDAARRAVAADPDNVLAHRFLAHALNRTGRHADAAQALAPALAPGGGDAQLFMEAGDALLQAMQYQAALEKFMEAVRLDPARPYAHYGMGTAFAQLGAPEAAAECYRTTVTLDPDHVEAWASLVHQSMHACRWSSLTQDLQQLRAAVARGGHGAIAPFAHLSFPDTTAAEHLASARAYAAGRFARSAPLPQETGARRRPGRIRIGYLSSDFHNHATSWLLAEVIELHDRSRFEIFLYSYGIDDGSPMRRRMMAAGEHFVDMREMSARAMAERIRADGIDILVDLKGYTFGMRAEVLGYRAAPIQVNFLGYPGSLGTPLVDYIITDPIVTPPEAAADYDEKFAYLPDCYQPNDRKRPIGAPLTRAACGLPERGFVFCCFNYTYKITPAVFDLWCRLLGEVEGSVLWLLDANLQAKANLRAEAAARGIDPQRLIFAPKLPVAQHLARLANADLVLDTLPVNAHTTASDALWAGVPVVTCPGKTFASRVAASLCTAAGITETIADSLDGYHAIALRLATAPDELQRLRARLAQTRMTCALFDSARYTANLEGLYARMFERCQQGLPPEQLSPQAAPARSGAAIRAQSAESAHIVDAAMRMA